MASWFQRIGVLALTVKGWVFIATATLPTIWAGISGVLEGLPTSVVIFLTMSTLAVSSCFAYYGMVGFDYSVRYLGGRKDMWDASGRLGGMLDVGHDKMPIGEIASIWAGEDAGKAWVINPRIRRLKKAAADGAIKVIEEPHAPYTPLNISTIVDLSGVITLLKDGKI
jgi:hypothetical protein